MVLLQYLVLHNERILTMKTMIAKGLLCLMILSLAVSCATPPPSLLEPTQTPLPTATVEMTEMAGDSGAAPTIQAVSSGDSSLTPTVEYTLSTSSGHDGLAFVGVGGTIDGVMNPTLTANPGDIVKITVTNGDGVIHNLTIDEFKVSTGDLANLNDQAGITFAVPDAGEFVYYCAIVGHRQAGMFGKLVVGTPVAAATGASVIHDPKDVPPPLGNRAPQTVVVNLIAQEVVGQLADGTTFPYMTYNGTIPGPFIRVRVGDTVELHLKNDTTSQFTHSIDLHAVTGPGGGAVYSQEKPGEEGVFTFKALNPGLFVYHCATPSIPHHMASGMYGLILVEPEGGLPPVDREFYVMQGEIYSSQPYGTTGALTFDATKLANETPDYFVFNGAAGALASDQYALRAKVGETVRIYFGVGGPNFTSSFHVIGEIFDKVYPYASLTSDPITDVQTVSVAPGGAVVVEFKLDVPGKYILVDHALSRLERGLVGLLYVEGDDQPDIFHQGAAGP
jgi:nitrite reductase (NO-forming)